MSTKILLCLVLAHFVLLASSYTVVVVPSTEECFFEHIEKYERVAGSFNVASGGFMDIDFKIFDPSGKVAFDLERESEATFSFISNDAGMYRFCFSNSMSTVTAKTVSFQLHVGSALGNHEVAKKEHLTPLENSVVMLSDGLKSVHDTLNYLKIRERVHRNTNESTNSRVMWWFFFENVVLISMSLWQVYYLRHFFETKRQF